MAKPVLLDAVAYQMLLEVAKRKRQKVSESLADLIYKSYVQSK